MRVFSELFGLRQQWLRLAFGILCLLALSISEGCSGGGGDSAPPSSPPPSAGAPIPPWIKVKDLGTVTLPAGTASEDFFVDVRGTSFMLIADGGRASDIDIHSLVDPIGTILVTADPNDTDPIGRNTLQAAGGSVAAGLFPHSPAYGIRLGVYSFKVQNFGGGTQNVKVSAILNNRVNPTGGTLNVNLVFCGIPDISAATAFDGQSPASQSFLTIFNEYRRVYGLANIQIAVSGVFDCPAADAARLTFISADDFNGNKQPDELDDLFSLSANFPVNALTYFFVQDPDGAAGISGGIPGPALTRGTPHSGVAVGTFGPLALLTQASAIVQGQTMAHEGAHFLGLFHTTERNAQATDPIPDSPSCPIARDANLNGAVDSAECLDLDGLNLMFWGPPAANTVQDGLTDGQKFVLDRNPLIQ